jgi:hypothetical protein
MLEASVGMSYSTPGQLGLGGVFETLMSIGCRLWMLARVTS